MKKATVPKNTLPVLYVFPDKANGCNVGRQRTRRKCGQQPKQKRRPYRSGTVVQQCL